MLTRLVFFFFLLFFGYPLHSFVDLTRPPVIVSDASWADYQRRTLLAEYILYRQAAMNWNDEERERRFEHIPGLYPHPLDPTTVRKHRDRSKQESRWECDRCGKRYKYSRGLAMHRRLECGKEPMFHCPYCPQKCHQKGNMVIHIKKKHPNHTNNNQPSATETDWVYVEFKKKNKQKKTNHKQKRKSRRDSFPSVSIVVIEIESNTRPSGSQ